MGVNVRWHRSSALCFEFEIVNPAEKLHRSSTDKSWIIAKATETSTIGSRLGFTLNTYLPDRKMSPRLSRNCSVSMNGNHVRVCIRDPDLVLNQTKKKATIAHCQHSYLGGSVFQVSIYREKFWGHKGSFKTPLYSKFVFTRVLSGPYTSLGSKSAERPPRIWME